MTAKRRMIWTFVVTSAALFMASLDNLVVTTAASNAIRELGGVLGIAVLGAVFSARGGYTTGHAFVSGLTPALWAGAAAVAAAAATLLIPQPAAAPARPDAVPARLARAAEQADPQQTERNPRPAAHATVIGGTS